MIDFSKLKIDRKQALVLLSGGEHFGGVCLSMAHTFTVLDAVREELKAKAGKDIGLVVTFGGHGFESQGVKWAQRAGILAFKGSAAPHGPLSRKEDSNRRKMISMLEPDLIVILGRRPCNRHVSYLGHLLRIPTLNVRTLPPAEVVAERARTIPKNVGPNRRNNQPNQRLHGEQTGSERAPKRHRNGRFVGKDG